jgi:estrone sulfotransferase
VENKKIFYLTSFPKSGNTWVNFTIANMYNQLTGRLPEIDFHNIHDINPEIRPNDRECKEPLFKELPWIFMTHSPYKADFENAILVIRNPWDVLYSYCHYLNGERRRNLSLPEVIKHEQHGIRPLVEHNESFIRNCGNLLIVTYENMHTNPIKEAGKIAEFLDLDIDDLIIKTAVKKASFKSMRKVEVKKGRKYGTPGFLFTRKGKTGEGKQEIKKYKELDDYILKEIKKSPLLFLLYS